MGVNQSVQISDSISKTVNNTLTEVVNNMKTTSRTDTFVKQTAYVNLKHIHGCKNIDIQQISSIDVSALTQMTDETKNDLATKLANNVSDQISQVLAQKNSGLNLGQINSGYIKSEVQKYLTNNINNIVKTSMEKSIVQTTGTEQKVYINVEDATDCENLNAIQGASISIVANAITKSIADNVVKSSAVNDATTKVSQESDQKNAGLSFGVGFLLILFLGVFCLFKGLLAKIVAFIVPILMGVVGYYIHTTLQYNNSKDDKQKHKLTLYSLIALEVLLFMVWMFSIYKSFTSKGPLDSIPKEWKQKAMEMANATASSSSSSSQL
jgi:hypothetical protein